MKNNETGEFELVVGNRQLLSGFFIVVLLFAVAFAMGYVVGQNSRQTPKPPTEAAASATPGESRPQPASAAPTAPPAAQPDQTAAQSAEAQPIPAGAPPQPTTQPAQDARQSSQAAGAPATPPAADAAPGTYWQVLATANQTSAQMLLQTLKDKGFPASLGPGPNNWTRVLVGPFTDTAAMGKAKTELENAGLHPVKH